MTLREDDVLHQLLIVDLCVLVRLQPDDRVGNPLHVYLLESFLAGHIVAIAGVTIIVIDLLNLLTILLVLLVVVVLDLDALILQRLQLDLLSILLHQKDAGVHLGVQGLVPLTLTVKGLNRILVR